MNTKKILFAALISIATIGSVLAQNTPPLHKNVETFLNTHFQNIDMVGLEVDANDRDMYELDLADGTELEFDRNGELLKMENDAGLPLTALPHGIGAYINATFPNQMVESIEKERNGYEVELTNDLELKFNKEGAFVREDK